MNPEAFIEVVRPQPLVAVRHVKPATLPADSLAERVIEAAGAKVRSIYLAGKRRADSVENFFDACADTHRAHDELADALPDDRLLSLGIAVFERAGFLRENLHPTTLRAQVDMQVTAVEAARNAYNFLRTQQSFNLGA